MSDMVEEFGRVPAAPGSSPADRSQSSLSPPLRGDDPSRGMVERVAKAICEAQGLDWDAQASFMTSAGGGEDEQEGLRTLARAAIEAMREPTEEMIRAALREGIGVQSIYRVMIDTALQNQENPK